ncbi:MAG: hypothetical protein ABIM98_04155 [candidate division WOR-3 bacterium]
MKIGRFEVMATLQAARAFCLGKPLNEAKSFGLNRAIFYAAAKRGFKHKIREPRKEITQKELEKIKEKLEGEFKIDRIGDEYAYCIEKEGKKYYVIGKEILTEEEFQKQIERKFKGNWEKAFEEAVNICKSYEKGILLSQRSFYEIVYKPRRDELAKKWSEIF